MVATIGRMALAFLAFIGDEMFLLADALGWLVRGKVGVRRALFQMSVAGTDSLPIVIITLLLVGMAWSWHTAAITVEFGVTSYFGGSTAVAITRELGPALCGVVVAARIGSAYAAELGTMAVTEQVDALRALAISPVYYLVVPRLIACVFMLPLLTLVSDASGMLGAYLLSAHFGIARGAYLASIRQWLDWPDIWGGILKALLFGVIIALVGCRQGLRTKGGAAGVGAATISSVVVSIVLIYTANLALTALLYAP